MCNALKILMCYIGFFKIMGGIEVFRFFVKSVIEKLFTVFRYKPPFSRYKRSNSGACWVIWNSNFAHRKLNRPKLYTLLFREGELGLESGNRLFDSFFNPFSAGQAYIVVNNTCEKCQRRYMARMRWCLTIRELCLKINL